jgi:hypothetical protein
LFIFQKKELFFWRERIFNCHFFKLKITANGLYVLLFLHSSRKKVTGMARKRMWQYIPVLERKRIIYKVRRTLSKHVVPGDIVKVIKSVFTEAFNHGLHARSKDYVAKAAVVENIATELSILKEKEHQSGAFKALVSAYALDPILVQ